MRDKKAKDDKTSEQDALVQRVDTMMSTELPDNPPSPSKPVVMPDEPADKKADDQKPDDKKPDEKPLVPKAPKTPKDQKTAPELPSELLKDTKANEAKETAEKIEVTKLETPAKPPIVISLADEDMSSEEQLTEPSVEAPKEIHEEPAAEDKPEIAEPSQVPDKDPLEDNATDKAVDDIVAHEGDTVLAVNDAVTARKQATAEPGQPSGPRRSHKWFWIIILIVLLGTGADAAIFLLRR